MLSVISPMRNGVHVVACLYKKTNAPGTYTMNQILESNYIETYTFKYFNRIPT